MKAFGQERERQLVNIGVWGENNGGLVLAGVLGELGVSNSLGPFLIFSPYLYSRFLRLF